MTQCLSIQYTCESSSPRTLRHSSRHESRHPTKPSPRQPHLPPLPPNTKNKKKKQYTCILRFHSPLANAKFFYSSLSYTYAHKSSSSLAITADGFYDRCRASRVVLKADLSLISTVRSVERRRETEIYRIMEALRIVLALAALGLAAEALYDGQGWCYNPEKDFYPYLSTRTAYYFIHGNLTRPRPHCEYRAF